MTELCGFRSHYFNAFKVILSPNSRPLYDHVGSYFVNPVVDFVVIFTYRFDTILSPFLCGFRQNSTTRSEPILSLMDSQIRRSLNSKLFYPVFSKPFYHKSQCHLLTFRQIKCVFYQLNSAFDLQNLSATYWPNPEPYCHQLGGISWWFRGKFTNKFKATLLERILKPFWNQILSH